MNYEVVAEILECLIIRNEQLVNEGEVKYIALLSTQEKIDTHLQSLQYLVDRELIKGYDFRDSNTNGYIITLFKKESY